MGVRNPPYHVCTLLAIMQESTPVHAIHGFGAMMSYDQDTHDEALMPVMDELIPANDSTNVI